MLLIAEHRIEFVRKLSGIEFYNDSKATNVKSTSIAINSFNVPIILLMGGYDRNHSFEDLKVDLSNRLSIIMPTACFLPFVGCI